jgi:hypothetical protein
MEYTLDELGFLLNEIKKFIDIKFRRLAGECEFRREAIYWTDTDGKEYRGWMCTNPGLKDKKFDWGCKFSSCPCINLDPDVDERDYYIIDGRK